MKYEIINPSDKCHLEADDEKVAIAAGILLSHGSYALKRPDQSTALPILRFGGTDEFLHEVYGGAAAFMNFLTQKSPEIAACLDTVALSGNRTSLNDIKKHAEKIAEKVRKAHKEELEEK